MRAAYVADIRSSDGFGHGDIGDITKRNIILFETVAIVEVFLVFSLTLRGVLNAGFFL